MKFKQMSSEGSVTVMEVTCETVDELVLLASLSNVLESNQEESEINERL